MPRNAAVSVGYLWGRPGRRTCGIFAGFSEGLRGSPSWSFRDLRPPAFEGRFAAKNS